MGPGDVLCLFFSPLSLSSRWGTGTDLMLEGLIPPAWPVLTVKDWASGPEGGWCPEESVRRVSEERTTF